jgi:predicted Zn-dependent protease
MGATAFSEMKTKEKLSTNKADIERVQRVGKRMAEAVGDRLPSAQWEFAVFDADATLNAFALPGGKVFITVGLLKEMTNEAQLAAVLGHEVGHVTARHVSERIGQAGIADIVIQAAAAGVGAATDSSVATEVAGTAFNYGGQMVVLKFSRDQESESDSLGMRYMTKLGYDPRGALQVQEILQRAMAASGGRGLEIMATHPYPDTRIQRIQAELKKSPY